MIQSPIPYSISLNPYYPTDDPLYTTMTLNPRARQSQPKNKPRTRRSHLTPSKIPKAGRASIIGSSEEVFSVFSDSHRLKKGKSKLGSRDTFSGVLGRSRAFNGTMQSLDESRVLMKTRIRQYSRLDNYQGKKQVRSLTVGVRVGSKHMNIYMIMYI